MKKTQAADKLKASSQIRHDKVDTALAELTDAKTGEEGKKVALKTMSETIREKELPWFSRTKDQALLQDLKVRIQSQ